MRNLFLALVLANLLYLGWRLWIVPPEVPAGDLRPVAGEAAATPLRSLRQQAPPPPGAGLAPAPSEPGATATGAARLRVGPLADGQVADALRARLAAGGFGATLATEDGQVWVGHWVQLESVSTREEADRAVARLAAGGLPDAYVLQATPPFTLSLGVFRDRAKADAVAAAATRLGFRARLTDRYRAGLQYWLAVTVPGGKALSLEQLGRETGQILRAEAVPCGTGAPAGPVGGTPAIP